MKHSSFTKTCDFFLALVHVLVGSKWPVSCTFKDCVQIKSHTNWCLNYIWNGVVFLPPAQLLVRTSSNLSSSQCCCLANWVFSVCHGDLSSLWQVTQFAEEDCGIQLVEKNSKVNISFYCPSYEIWMNALEKNNMLLLFLNLKTTFLLSANATTVFTQRGDIISWSKWSLI